MTRSPSSRNGSAVLLPYTSLVEVMTTGFFFLLALASTTSVAPTFVSMVRTGLSTISSTPTAAARWYTTSASSTSSATTGALWHESIVYEKRSLALRCRMLLIEPVERSSRAWTAWPRESSSSARWEPTKPAPPVIRMRMCGGSSRSSRLRPASSISRYGPRRRGALSGRIGPGRGSGRGLEPAEAGVERADARDLHEGPLDRRPAPLARPVLAPVLGLLLGDRGVVRAAGVVHAQIGHDRRPVPERVDVADVARVLEPEDLGLALLEAARQLVEPARRDRAAAAGRSGEEAHAVVLDELVLVRAHVVTDPRRLVVEVVLEVRGQEADVRQRHVRVAHHPVPALGRVRHVVVDLDEERRRRRAERARVGVLADVLLAADHPDARVGQRGEVLGRAVGGRVVPDDDLLGGVRRAQQHVLDALADQVRPVVRQDDDRDPAVGGVLLGVGHRGRL